MESHKLKCWFGLSRSSFAILPRVLMEQMPVEWQDKMADLLNEADETWQNIPCLTYRVMIVGESGKIQKTPSWLTNYRHPEREILNSFKKEPNQ